MRYLSFSDPRGPGLAWGPGPRLPWWRRWRRWRRLHLWMVLAMSLSTLSGCAGYVERYHQVQACRVAAGPEPYAEAHAFGLIGSLYQMDHPEFHAWADRVDTCFARARAASVAGGL